MQDYTGATLESRDRVMLDFAAKLTLTPRDMTADDIGRLCGVGFDDPAIHDIVQVTALFNYYDRLADGLGIDLEHDMPPR